MLFVLAINQLFGAFCKIFKSVVFNAKTIKILADPLQKCCKDFLNILINMIIKDYYRQSYSDL